MFPALVAEAESASKTGEDLGEGTKECRVRVFLFCYVVPRCEPPARGSFGAKDKSNQISQSDQERKAFSHLLRFRRIARQRLKEVVQFRPRICLCFFLCFFSEVRSQSPNEGLGLSACCLVRVFGSLSGCLVLVFLVQFIVNLITKGVASRKEKSDADPDCQSSQITNHCPIL